MKTALVATGLGIITTAAAVGPTALASLGVLVLAAIVAACWIVSDRSRTANVVAIITAGKRQQLHLIEQRTYAPAPGEDPGHASVQPQPTMVTPRSAPG
jgi:hypothetical protein